MGVFNKKKGGWMQAPNIYVPVSDNQKVVAGNQKVVDDDYQVVSFRFSMTVFGSEKDIETARRGIERILRVRLHTPDLEVEVG